MSSPIGGVEEEDFLDEEERERVMALIAAQSRTTGHRGRSEASVLDQRA
jgi:hypothetical protein